MSEPNLFSILFDFGKMVVYMFQNNKEGLDRMKGKVNTDYYVVKQKYDDYRSEVEHRAITMSDKELKYLIANGNKCQREICEEEFKRRHS